MDPATQYKQKFIGRLTEIITDNLQNERFGVKELAREMGMSRSSLHRKITEVAKLPANQFICQVRLKKAIEMLRETTFTVSETAYECGFHSVTYFSKCFRNFYGISPGEVRKGLKAELTAESEILEIGEPKLYTKKRRIHLLVSVVFLLAAVAFLFMNQKGEKKASKQTIAVLPFTDNSPDNENNYIIAGLRNEIMNHLSSLENIQLVSRNASENYKNSDKSMKEIGGELKANFILTGDGQSINDKINIRLKLIEASTNKNLFVKPYEEEVTLNNIFDIPNRITNRIANELNIVLTPEDIKAFNQKDTVNIEVYANYLRGMDYYNVWWNEQNYENLLKSKRYFLKAVSADSTFAQAFYKLAFILYDEPKYIIGKGKKDSAWLLINKAIRFNPEYSEAYSFKGFLIQSKTSEALQAFHNAIKFGSDKPDGYHQLGNYYCNICEYAESIKNSMKSIEVNNEPVDIPWTLINLSVAFSSTGFFREAEKYADKYLKQYDHMKRWFHLMLFKEMTKGNFRKSIAYGIQAYNMDSTDWTTLDFLGINYLFLKDLENAQKYYQKYINNLKLQFEFNSYESLSEFILWNNRHSNTIGHDAFPMLHFAYLLSLNDKNLSEEYFSGIKLTLASQKENNSLWYQNGCYYYELACVEACQNEIENALQSLAGLKTKTSLPVWMPLYLKNSPLLDNVRSRPEFAETLREVEKIVQAEQEKVKNLLINLELL